MATDQDFVDFLVDQMEDAGPIAFKKMFGEYALYCNGKVVALVCDNQLFVKPTAGGRAHVGAPVEAPPYPGAKPYLWIEDAFEDRAWIGALIRITAKELPAPKPQRKNANPATRPRRDRP
jgi:TfoX/Sxy family transcriptional regulator of competence genes